MAKNEHPWGSKEWTKQKHKEYKAGTKETARLKKAHQKLEIKEYKKMGVNKAEAKKRLAMK